MKEFFTSMETAQQIYWYIAIGASLFFIIQTILTFIGADTDTGVDADFDGDLDGGGFPFQLFSLRNLVNFLLGLGWTGVALYNSIASKFVLGLVAVFVGLFFIAICFYIMRFFMKMAEDNSFKIEDAIGNTGSVYLTIPANKQGRGRVQISVKGSVHELDAITDDKEPLKNGSLIKVLKTEGNILVVETLNKK